MYVILSNFSIFTTMKIRYGSAEPNQKTAFSLVSALAFHYICAHKRIRIKWDF